MQNLKEIEEKVARKYEKLENFLSPDNLNKLLEDYKSGAGNKGVADDVERTYENYLLANIVYTLTCGDDEKYKPVREQLREEKSLVIRAVDNFFEEYRKIKFGSGFQKH